MKKVISLLVLVLIAGYFFYPETVITYPPGITAADPPRQVKLSEDKVWVAGDYTMTALAEYSIKARVLSRNNFHLGRESDLSPLDLALGWGSMSDQSIIDQIDISQSNRWYHWKAAVLPIPASEISSSSANVHIIPKDETVKDKLDEVLKGSLIEMNGYLVRITAEDGWKWTSSLRRDDTGGGSCEILWVDDITILEVEEGQ
jgi:hypothetical protein